MFHMDARLKILQLKSCIVGSLKPLIGRKCILLDAPYYHNIGDVLIWKGEKSFLSEHHIQCLYNASYETCTYPKIAKDVTVLFNGGGNLGDLYHEHMDFLQKVVLKYPNNRIVICPQTVYYTDKSRMKDDFKLLLQHENLYFCARDKVTFSILVEYFGDNTRILPDMAFYIPDEDLRKYELKVTKTKLIIERKDCESLTGRIPNDDGDIYDWPTFEHSFHRSTFLNKVLKRISDAHIPCVSKYSNHFWDYYFMHYFAEKMFMEGVRFISPYKEVETTRLHGCILSVLLGKKITLVDNSYGKNGNFYNTWLYDMENVKLKSK